MTISSDRLKSYEALITCFRKLLAPLPAFVKRDIERHLNQIDSLIQASRPPRFMIFGQRGAAKATEKVGEAAIAYFIDKTPIQEVKQKFGFTPA